jgi:hypothetical protein
MTLPRNERIQAKDMLKICREQIERLSETSPQSPNHILDMFHTKMGKKYEDVAIPDVANGLKRIVINSPHSPSSPVEMKSLPIVVGAAGVSAETLSVRLPASPENQKEQGT